MDYWRARDEADLLAIRVNLLHGRRLNELEKALQIAKLIEIYGWTQDQVAERARYLHTRAVLMFNLLCARDWSFEFLTKSNYK